MLHDNQELIAELQCLQRYRVQRIKIKTAQINNLTAIVASSIGYHSGLEESDREKKYREAERIIRAVKEGEPHELQSVIEATMMGTDALDHSIKSGLEKQMEKLAKQLPVVDWVNDDQQRGFGLLRLAVVVGEAGDLGNYPNPGKLWARFGMHPYASRDKNLMGSTWRVGREGKLSADEWTDYGYSPRRRSIMHIIGEALLKLNHSIYRERYDRVKAEYPEKHPDRVRCGKCTGTGKNTKGNSCGNCKGTGVVMMRAHLHAMLLMEKLLLKELWCQWNPDLYDGDRTCETESALALAAV